MGKTTISQYLASVHQLLVLDADLYARDAVAIGSPILQKIVERYGPEILLESGYLDRRRLGSIIFPDPLEREWLEQQIHPYVRDRFQAVLADPASPGETPIVLVIPLLFEAQMQDLVTEVWVVATSREAQRSRLIQREQEAGLSPNPEEVQARIDSQMPIEQKIAAADVVLKNTSTLADLYAQVDLALAQGKSD